MDMLIANVDSWTFKIEKDLNEQYGALALPFPGMDSKWLRRLYPLSPSVEPDCVPCAVGTFYNVSSKTCLPCPEGSYQPEIGQLQCKSCPKIAGRPGVTALVGARSAVECKGK